MVEVLVILDGASEPLGHGPTSLERAGTPVLDELAATAVLTRLRTVPAGLPAGSETAIPALLGWTPNEPVDRGALEAAARDLALAAGDHAWRIDVLNGDQRADDWSAREAAKALQVRAPRHEVRCLHGHRLLLVGPRPLPLAARRSGLRPWPEGVVPPRILGPATVVIAACGAALGAARLLGAATVVPSGATGEPDTHLGAKAACATAAIAAGATRVVVHVGGPDEAAHRRDRPGKVAMIERIDRELIAPLVVLVRSVGATLRICPDHACDPATGEHAPDAVPCLSWPAPPGTEAAARFTERAVAELPEVELGAVAEAA